MGYFKPSLTLKGWRRFANEESNFLTDSHSLECSDLKCSENERSYRGYRTRIPRIQQQSCGNATEIGNWCSQRRCALNDACLHWRSDEHPRRQVGYCVRKQPRAASNTHCSFSDHYF